ncbi:hypothetical protein AAMO2058_000283000 [Amorphochlora amoebiformis]
MDGSTFEKEEKSNGDHISESIESRSEVSLPKQKPPIRSKKRNSVHVSLRCQRNPSLHERATRSALIESEGFVFKNLSFLPDTAARLGVWDSLSDVVRTAASSMDIGNTQSKEDMSEEKSESDGGLLSLEDDYTSNTPTASEMITSEIQKYRSWDVSNRVDPLKWWRDNRFPNSLSSCQSVSGSPCHKHGERANFFEVWVLEKWAPKQDGE